MALQQQQPPKSQPATGGTAVNQTGRPDLGSSFIQRDTAGREVSRAEFHEEPHTVGTNDRRGYLPLTLGQSIHNGKLEIVRKLGWGGTGTVWLARVRNNAYPVKYVAVKALTSYMTLGVNHGYPEIDMLEHVKEKANSSTHPGARHFVKLYDTFEEKSDHGDHVCIVSEILAGDLLDLCHAYNMGNALPLALVKKIIKQHLEGLAFLHKTCNIVHIDILPQNALIFVPNLDAVIEQSLRVDPSATYPPRDEDKSSPEPILTVKSQPIIYTHDTLDHQNVEIRIGGFVEAQPIGKRVPDDVQSLILRAPEVILGYSWTEEIDIWNIGCLTYEYITGVELFQLDFKDEDLDTAIHLQHMMEVTGEKFEVDYLNLCSNQKKYFNTKTHNLLRTDKPGPGSLEARLKQHKVHDQDIPSIVAFIHKCLALDPRKRQSADQLLRDPWLASV